MRGRGLVAGVLLVAAVVALVVAFTTGGSGSNAEAQAGPGVTTPLWSVRRVPEPVVEAVGAQHLQPALDAAAPGDGTCFVVSGRATDTLATHDAGHPPHGRVDAEAPVAAAALSILGPDTTFADPRRRQPGTDRRRGRSSLARGRRRPGAGHERLRGVPQVAAESRATTSITSLETLADAIVAKGVRRIPGGVLGDDSRYDQERYRPSLPDDDRQVGQVGPMSALEVNDGFSTWAPVLQAGSGEPTELRRVRADRPLGAARRRRSVAPAPEPRRRTPSEIASDHLPAVARHRRLDARRRATTSPPSCS